MVAKTFSFWGASATNSADGQGLTKGMLYFDSMFKNDGIRIWKTVWNKGNQTENSVTEEIESGWYKSVPCYQFFTYNNKRYVAYTRQVDGYDRYKEYFGI